jgi:hypothetical protein
MSSITYNPSYSSIVGNNNNNNNNNQHPGISTGVLVTKTIDTTNTTIVSTFGCPSQPKTYTLRSTPKKK